MDDQDNRLCKQCHDHFRDEDSGLCFTCERKNARKARVAKVQTGEMVPFYVAAIGIDRCFGGPEEGGWYYDVNSVLKVFKVWDVKHAVRMTDLLKEEFPTCPRGRHSVIGGQDTYVKTFRTLEDLPSEDHSRPRYE
jgi:hypothetical protein